MIYMDLIPLNFILLFQIFDAEFETEDSEDEEYDPENESTVCKFFLEI